MAWPADHSGYESFRSPKTARRQPEKKKGGGRSHEIEAAYFDTLFFPRSAARKTGASDLRASRRVACLPEDGTTYFPGLLFSAC